MEFSCLPPSRPATSDALMASPGLVLEGSWSTTCKLGLGSAHNSSSLRLRGAAASAAVSLPGSSSSGGRVVRLNASTSAVSTAPDSRFLKVSDDYYAENSRPPHITDIFDVPARPSTFCAKTR